MGENFNYDGDSQGVLFFFLRRDTTRCAYCFLGPLGLSFSLSSFVLAVRRRAAAGAANPVDSARGTFRNQGVPFRTSLVDMNAHKLRSGKKFEVTKKKVAERKTNNVLTVNHAPPAERSLIKERLCVYREEKRR